MLLQVSAAWYLPLIDFSLENCEPQGQTIVLGGILRTGKPRCLPGLWGAGMVRLPCGRFRTFDLPSRRDQPDA